LQCGSSEGYFCKALPSLLAAGWVCQARVCCHTPGELLPHLFTLTCGINKAHRRFVFCGTFPRLSAAAC